MNCGARGQGLTGAPVLSEPSQLSFLRLDQRALCLQLSGNWTLRGRLPSAEEVRNHLDSAPGTQRILFDTRALTGWDSGLLVFLINVRDLCAANNFTMDREGLPPGVRKLLDLAAAVPEKKGARREPTREPVLVRVGNEWLSFLRSLEEALSFLGEATVSLLRFMAGRARYRRSDLALIVQECGAQALPIVSLISVLVGLILAFVGAIQLQMFGAQIFVANLVGIGMAREMGALMAAIIMAGRTGAAFAAQLGTMQVNEEIDALQTLGISPMEFLVLPRMLALVLMMPLLCLYADVLGIVGGFLVGVGMLDLSPIQYYNQTLQFLGISDFAVGVFKAVVFGILIAVSGCLRGLQCGRSAAAVGAATTSAVVTAIVFIVVADGLFAVITTVVGI